MLDKVASVTRNCPMGREVRVSKNFPCQEGDVVAVRVMSHKSTYNKLELVCGRFSELKRGDVVAGVLGHRDALCGYVGHMPESLAVGAQVHLLNLGGVLGIADSWNPDLGAPGVCEVLGQVLHFPFVGERRGVPANIKREASARMTPLNCRGIPVVAVVGTAMNCGKTFACTALIQELVRRGKVVAAAKATGVSLRRDILAMEDAGALQTAIFTDFGVVTTTPANAPALTRSMLTELARGKPDLLVLELGDGLLGSYGVDAILDAPDIRQVLGAVVLAAHDPVGAWGGVRRLREAHHLQATLLTGPVTDNTAGARMASNLLKLPAWNARLEPAALADAVLLALAAKSPPVSRAARA